MTQIAQDPQSTSTIETQGTQRTRGKPQTVKNGSRLAVFLHALAFVFGFGAVFTLIGSAAGLLGYSLYPYLSLIQKIGAVMLVIFALVTFGVFRFLAWFIRKTVNIHQNPAAAALVSFFEFFNRLLYTERRITDMHQVSRKWGYLSSAMLGVSFSAGWVPCVGPILASIFFLAQDSATAAQGAGLLGIYSLGLGIPFLITGAAFSSMSNLLRRINRFANIIGFISGAFLLAVAILLWTDSLALLTTRFFYLNELVFELEDQVSVASGTGGDLISMSFIAAAPLALIAGLISFISPCVLPLVPAYIGYLSGTAVGGQQA